MSSQQRRQPSLTADIVVLAGAPDSQVLLVRRGSEPFEGRWALPGGFVEPGERASEAAARELEEETGISGKAYRLVGVYDAPERDPRGWIVSIAQLVLLDTVSEARGGDDAAEARWWPTGSLPTPLAFDHEQIIADALAL